jgi:hypothetical protein
MLYRGPLAGLFPGRVGGAISRRELDEWMLR